MLICSALVSLKRDLDLFNKKGLTNKDNISWNKVIKNPINKKILTIFILPTPVVHKISNSCCFSNFTIELVNDKRNANGTKRVTIVVIFSKEYLK